MSSEDKENSDELDIGEIYTTVKKQSLAFLNWKYTYELLLLPIIWLTWWIRTRNLSLLENKYLLGLDPYYYYRMANDVLSTGSMPAFDAMRVFPFGKPTGFNLFPYFLAYWNKFLNIFTDIPLIYSNILYNPIFTSLSIVFFYLFLKNTFNKKVALLAPLILIVSPAYLFRTVAGFADHEALFMFLMFLSMWSFSELKIREKFNVKIWFALISGFATFLAATTWSAIPILTIPIGAFILMEILWNNKNRKDFVTYSVWLGAFLVPLFVTKGFGLVGEISTLAPIFALVSLGIYLMISSKNINLHIPDGLASIIIAGILGITISLVFDIINFKHFWEVVLSPAEATGRVADTISEIIAGAVVFNTFGWFLVLALLGATLSAYYSFEGKNTKVRVSLAVATLVVGWIILFSKQTTTFLNVMLLVAFAITLLIIYTLNKSFTPTKNQQLMILPLVMFLFTSYLTGTAARFLFVFAPTVAIFASYFVFKTIDISPKKYRLFVAIVILVLTASLVFNDFEKTSGQAKHMGSGLPGKWQSSFNWIKDNTPEGSGIAHWWDYGYWTQTVGERPSIADGGTHGEYMLYLLGRYGMTGQSREEALTYYKTHNISYLLFSPEEIGKYWAFSHIGSNKNLDRESTIGSFGLAEIKEIRGGNKLIYRGGWRLDQDIVMDGKVFKKDSARMVEFSITENDGMGTAVITDGSKVVEEPVYCIIKGSKKITYGTGSKLRGCFVFISAFDDQGRENNISVVMYLSEKVVDGLFARLYITREKIEGFDEVYNDGTPLGIYKGQIIGPIIIWKISYSEEIGTNPLWRSISPEREEGFR